MTTGKITMFTRSENWVTLTAAQRRGITQLKEDADRHVANGDPGDLRVLATETREIMRKFIADVPHDELVAFVADLTALQILQDFKDHLIVKALKEEVASQ